MSDKHEAQDEPAGSESEQSQKGGKPQSKHSAHLIGQDQAPQDLAPQEPASSRLATPKSVRSSASKKGKKLKEAQDGEQQQPEAEPEQQQEQPEQQAGILDTAVLGSTPRQMLSQSTIGRALGFQAQPGQP